MAQLMGESGAARPVRRNEPAAPSSSAAASAKRRGARHHIAGATSDLHGACRPLEQRLSEELGVRWLRFREPGLRRKLVSRARGPGRRGPWLCQPRRRRRRGSGGTSSRSRSESPRARRPATSPTPASCGRAAGRRSAPRASELLLAAGGRKGRVADVVVEVEAAGRRPTRAVPVRGGRSGASAESGAPDGAGTAMWSRKLLLARRRSLEDRRRGHVHVHGAGLQVQKRGVEATQPVPMGHGEIISDGAGSAKGPARCRQPPSGDGGILVSPWTSGSSIATSST